jgi:hypothetical protein
VRAAVPGVSAAGSNALGHTLYQTGIGVTSLVRRRCG